MSEHPQMIIKQLESGREADALAWDAFVQSCEDATFFHKAGWKNIIEAVFRHQCYFLYAEKAGKIQGILPLAHVKSFLFGRSLTSLPFAVYGGVVAVDQDAAGALEKAAVDLARSLGVDHLEFRNLRQRHGDWPTQDLYVTFRKTLDPDPDANMAAIPRKQRAMVRKGIKNGLKSEIDQDVSRFFNLYADNVHRHGTPALPKRYFEALRHVFADDVEVLTVTDQAGSPISAVLSFYFKDEVLPYYAGDALAARDLAGNDFKYWELMRRCCEKGGVNLFDYGRSKQGTGSFSFKKNWGFEPQPLFYEYQLYKADSIPQHNPMNAKYRYFIEAWRRMPIGLANWLGPHIVRNLG